MEKLKNIESQQLKTMHALVNAVIEKQEILDGFVYTFLGNDQALRQLFDFIAYHRTTFPLFKFELAVQDLKSNIRLKITGPDGIKESLQSLNL